MIDWDRPIEAVPRDGGPAFRVKIDRTYHHRPDAAPVEFPTSPWTSEVRGACTHYVNNDGTLFAADEKTRFTVRNSQ
ncbi:hypothetical protein SAMN06295937_101197 [Sphingopyxis flava]|uniref:Uncharacterized protein n=1 Tax=Sphingopyxis flava TaxID=1507287 RepID=A0A1T5CT49_9SPHN|nr:hypothetical protein SAMN06295937_101197 [Sphingopyxis flava]